MLATEATPRLCKQCDATFVPPSYSVTGEFCSHHCSCSYRRERAHDRLIEMSTRDTDDCVEWKYAMSADGYGRTRLNGRNMPAHRAAYSLHCGAIPAGHVVRHKCDNPRCVNYRHLELGTPRDNVQDCISRGRARYAKGEDYNRAVLTDGMVRFIRTSPLPVSQLAALIPTATISTIYKVRQGRTWRHV